MIALLSVLLILIGLPLLAWWIGGRRAWSRIDARGGDEMARYREWMTRNRLRQADVDTVDRAINRGKRVEDPRLRAATVERAQMMQDAMRAYDERRPGLLVAVRWLQALFLLVVVAIAVFSLALGEWPGGVPFWLIGVVGPAVAQYVQRRNLARALELNSAPDAT